MFCVIAAIFLAPGLLISPLVTVAALAALAAPAVSCLAFSEGPPRRFLFDLAVGGALALLISFIGPRQTPALPFLPDRICQIEGRLIGDSGGGAGGGAVLDLRIESCLASDGSWATANGIVRAFAKEPCALARGTRVVLDGRFQQTPKGAVFKAAALRVGEPASPFALMRLRIVERAAARLETAGHGAGPGSEPGCGSGHRLGSGAGPGSGASPGSALSIMLVLGRATADGDEIRTLARRCGCLHVLALSGMHLGFFAAVSKRLLFFSRRKSPPLLLGLALSVAFVLLIGPRSSLLRAVFHLAIVLADRLLGLRLADMERLSLAALFQFGIFPDSLFGMGTAFSYAATAGLLYLGIPMGRLLAAALPRGLAAALGSGAGALCVSAVLSLRIDGVWHPSALFASPLASFLVFGAMGVGFARMVWPEAPLLLAAGNLLNKLLKLLFSFPLAAGPRGLALFFLGLLTACGAILYARKRSGRRAEKDDLELQLRFAPGDKVPS